MKDDFRVTKKYINKLETRIKTAIKYIKNKVNELKEDHMYIVLQKEDIYKVLDILEGEDNE